MSIGKAKGAKRVGASYEMTFGKYQGKTIGWIKDNDPEYILWLDDNIDTMIIAYGIVEECTDRVYESVILGIDWIDLDGTHE